MNRYFRALMVSLTALLLLMTAGCGEEPQTATPTPRVVHVAITPAARHTGLAVSTCAATISGVDFEISEAYASQTDADLLIRLGEPQSAAFAAQIATEELLIVLHPDSPADSLTLEQVQDLFGGQIRSWAELGGADVEVQIWSLLPADETRTTFDQDVMQNSQIATTARLAPSPELMAATIASTPEAIGFLPGSWSTTDLTGILPGVSLPVLVVADTEPQGPARELVACLQGETGQELLAAFFSN
jgi:phosphate transport system substrate-binding protein